MKIASRGDLLLASPAFEELRRARPDAWIVLLVGASCEDVAQRLPFFDQIVPIDDRALFTGTLAERLRVAGRIVRLMRGSPSMQGDGRAGPFQEAYIFHRDWRYAFLARLAGIATRRGLSRGRYRGLLDESIIPAPREHDTTQYLRLVGSTAAPSEDGRSAPSLAGRWRFQQGERERAMEAARRYGFPADRPAVGLGFGGGRNVKTRTALKCWPLERYVRLAERIEELGACALWLGDAEDASMLEAGVPGVILAGRFTVAESAAVLGECHATVANDTLLLHLSEAVGTPTIGVFGPTDPAHYGPTGRHSTSVWIGESLPCSPCHRDGRLPPCPYDHRCMRELEVEMVLRHLKPHLARGVAGQNGGAVRVG